MLAKNFPCSFKRRLGLHIYLSFQVVSPRSIFGKDGVGGGFFNEFVLSAAHSDEMQETSDEFYVLYIYYRSYDSLDTYIK